MEDVKRCTRRIRTRDPMTSSPTHSPLDYQLQLPNRWKIFAIYALTILMYTVASPDPNPRGGVNYLTLTSGTSGIIYTRNTDVQSLNLITSLGR